MAADANKMTLAPGPRYLNVFLCHSSEDKPQVRELYKRLRADGCKPWLDEEDIPGGLPWEYAIESAVEAADAVIVCLSQHSITKEGFLQNELKMVLQKADQKLEETIFVIPVRLEECDIPRKLQRLQWINYFQENGHEKLLESLSLRAEQVQAVVPMTARSRTHGSVEGPFERADEAAQYVLRRTTLRPQMAVVLGSGLGKFADRLADPVSIDFDEIPHFPLPPGRVSFGRLAIGYLGEVPVLLMLGRLHGYEGLRWDEVVFPIRMLSRLEIRTVILTAAVGSLNPRIRSGTLAMVSDHINQLGSSPLVGPNDERFGPRFVDMTEVYSRHLRSKAMEVASHNNIELHEAVYLIHSGPTYETPAEIRAMRILGADLVGMSLVPEAMAARQMGQQVFAICVVTSELLGEQKTLTHEEVVESAQRMAGNFELLMTNLLPAISVSEGWD